MANIKFITKFLKIFFFISFIFTNNLYGDEIKEISITGNQRILDETIKSFLTIKINDIATIESINDLTKNLYDTNFFENVSVKIESNVLIIDVKENPIIQNIIYDGIKSETLKEKVIQNTKLIERSPYIDLFVKNDSELILDNLKNNGYYFSSVSIKTEKLENNTINLIYQINLGEKAKIKKISFIGNKVFKDKRLRSIILSEEYKFWKFISGKKFLNENLVKFDQRLLKNYYLNQGFYNVDISTTFAKIINEDEFELIFNINAGEKIYFGDLDIVLPINYDESDFSKLFNQLTKLKNQPYSINSIEKITKEIDLIVLNEQYETISIDVVEKINGNNLNLTFQIKEEEKTFVKKINIYGNNITRENVLRNQFEIDEGDFYNEILYQKTINNIKSLNFFKTVESQVLSDVNGDKIIEINVDEKATGEIGASAGVGTSGESFGFFVKENNYLGKGLSIRSDITLTSDSIKGSFSLTNPNYNDTDKSVSTSIEITEIDKLSDFGYKTNRNGFAYSTNFEIYEDLIFGIGNQNYYEKIETDSTASSLQKKQEGDYWDSFLNLNFIYDKRNQKFKPTNGFINSYAIDVPLLSKTNTLSNTFDYKMFTELYENNTTSLGFYLKASKSITNDNIKLTERNYLPSSKLRGFKTGGVGPKDGADFIGGNYLSSFNFNTSLPKILEENDNIDFLFFIDAANVWGVDYDTSIDDSNKIRSSAGIGIDWFTAIGPINFTISQPLTKADSDSTENFSFNLGTTF